MLTFLVWIFIILLAGFELFMLCSIWEHTCSVRIRRQYPPVSCSIKHCRQIVDEITKRYPNARSVVDIGAGHGRLGRAVAHIRGVNVIAIENMRSSVFIMRILNCLCFARGIKVIHADAFEYIKKSRKHFDIGIAYLGPRMNARLMEIAKKFDVIITLDAEIPGVNATRIIDISGGGHTCYPGVGIFPHRLFIYECGKI